MGGKSASRTDDMGVPPSPFQNKRSHWDGGDAVARAMHGLGRELAFGLKAAIVVFVLGLGWSLGIRFFGFKSDWAAVQHIVSGAGCDAAMWIKAVPAKEGEPGYWDHLDIDQDTVACDANDPAMAKHP